jgi:hypothetical protein
MDGKLLLKVPNLIRIVIVVAHCLGNPERRRQRTQIGSYMELELDLTLFYHP